MNPIVGIGEVLWDVYPDGRKVAGGAPFNFAFHCHQLGHPAAIVSRVGDDDLGRELRERVRELGLSDAYIQTDREHATGTVQVKLDSNAVPTYTITENVAWDHLAWDDTLDALSKTCRAICFGTLAARDEGTRFTVQRLLTTHRDHTLEKIVYDVNLRSDDIPDFVRWGVRKADWVKMNDDEFVRLRDWLADAGVPLEQFIDGPNTLIVTRGERGCLITGNDGGASSLGVRANVVDTVGAGDAFTAAMVCLHLEGKPMPECARFAVHYAARVCEHPGGTPRIDRADVERAAGSAP
jgi:fructokinase